MYSMHSHIIIKVECADRGAQQRCSHAQSRVWSREGARLRTWLRSREIRYYREKQTTSRQRTSHYMYLARAAALVQCTMYGHDCTHDIVVQYTYMYRSFTCDPEKCAAYSLVQVQKAPRTPVTATLLRTSASSGNALQVLEMPLYYTCGAAQVSFFFKMFRWCCSQSNGRLSPITLQRRLLLTK